LVSEQAGCDGESEACSDVAAAGSAGHQLEQVGKEVGRPSAAGRLAYTDAPFTLVADGLRSAIAQAQAMAGDRDVSITLAASPVGPSRPE
jgi:hypothetical protein